VALPLPVVAVAPVLVEAPASDRPSRDEDHVEISLEDFAAEGLENRYARHARLNQTVRDWAFAKGFKLFPKEGYGSVTLNCFANTLNVDLAALNKILKSKHGLVIDGGYGKLKGKAFRISNMGDETDETIAALIKALDSALAELGVK